MLNIKIRFASQAIIALGLIATTSGAFAQNWTNQAKMKVARVEATTIDYRDNIYVFNGFKPGIKIANSVEKYNAATKQWSIVSSTTTMNDSAVTHNGAVRIGAEVWIIGGRVGNHPGRVTKKVWIYNLNNGNWRPGPSLPVPVAAGGAAYVNNKVHWIGGLDPQARCDVNHHYVYDLGNPNAGWKNITAAAGIPTPRNHFSTAVVNGQIYVMGGQFGHDNCPGKNTDDSPLVHAFNPSNNKWTRKANMPNKNSHSEPGTFVYKNEIYTTGGENALTKVWKYNPQSNKWSTFRTLPEGLVAPIARIIDGRLIVAGGGAPLARLATDKVRSMQVDNNPPSQPDPDPEPPQPDPQPDPEPQPEPQPEPEPPQPEPGSHTPAGATLISMEAEYFDVRENTSTHQWVHVARGDSSNDDAMITNPDQGQLAASTNNTPMLSYMVNFNHTGKHYIWIRGSGDTNGSGMGNSDSIHVGMNGTVSSTAYRIDEFPSGWNWSRHTPSNPVASLNVVTAGVNVVNFWMREDGLAIDKFVITSDPNFVPTGQGPEVTDGSSDYVPPASSDNSDQTTDPVEDQPAENEAPVENDPVEPEAPVENAPVEPEAPVDNNPADNNVPADDPVVNEADTPTEQPVEPVANTPSDDPVQSEPEGSTQAESDLGENNTVEPFEEGNTSDDATDSEPAIDGMVTAGGKGLFGGSASITGLLVLFMLSLFSLATRRRFLS